MLPLHQVGHFNFAQRGTLQLGCNKLLTFDYFLLLTYMGV